jgi:methyl-accepting chemotaxis protein
VAAATLKTGTGKERWMGMEVSDVVIVERVLGNGEEYSGSVTLMGVPYYGAYVPLADVDEEVVGMLFVGKPQFAVLSAAGQAVEATFIAVALLIVLSIAPAGWVARYVSYQVS